MVGADGLGTALQAKRSRFRFPIASLLVFYLHNMALGSTQPKTEMSTKNISCGLKNITFWKEVKRVNEKVNFFLAHILKAYGGIGF